jgi:hypothetical protein
MNRCWRALTVTAFVTVPCLAASSTWASSVELCPSDPSDPLPCPSIVQDTSQITVPFGTGEKTISNPVTGPGTVTTSDSAGSWSASSVVNLSLAPIPHIDVSASSTNAISADSVLQISYEIEIVGASGIVPLTVEANERISSSTATSSSSSVELDLHLFDQSAYVETFEAGSDNGKPVDLPNNPFPVAQAYNTLANTPIEVEMLASAATEGLNFDGVEVSASAYLDPFFSVPEGYSIILSPGVGNSPIPSVPEPATWVMMLFGFMGVGWASRGSILRIDARKRDAAI